MAQQTINVGTSPNDGTGTPLRTAFQYTNSNFSELYTAVGPSGNNIVVPGSATITGDLTVDTSTLKVDSANNRVGVGTASPSTTAHIVGGNANTLLLDNGGQQYTQFILQRNGTANTGGDILVDGTGATINYRGLLVGDLVFQTSTSAGSPGERYRIASNGVATWSNVGGVAGTAMTLNSTGLGVGLSPSAKLDVRQIAAAEGLKVYVNDTGATNIINFRSYDNTLGEVTRYAVACNGVATWSNVGGVAGTAMTLNANGLGIGVTPSAWANFKALQVQYACFASNRFGAGNIQTFIGSNTFYDGSGYKYIVSDTAARYALNDNVHAWYNAPSGTAGNAITFTQAMTLTAAGELLVGTTSAGGIFDTKFFLSSNSGTNKWAVGPYGTATNFAIIPTPGTGGVYLSGTSATSWTAYSDERLKDIIEPITNALTKVGSLRSVIGKFKGDEANTRRPFLIAQDLQSALPEAVDASNPDRLGVSYTDVIPLLVAAIKELTARVQTLETR